MIFNYSTENTYNKIYQKINAYKTVSLLHTYCTYANMPGKASNRGLCSFNSLNYKCNVLKNYALTNTDGHFNIPIDKIYKLLLLLTPIKISPWFGSITS